MKRQGRSGWRRIGEVLKGPVLMIQSRLQRFSTCSVEIKDVRIRLQLTSPSSNALDVALTIVAENVRPLTGTFFSMRYFRFRSAQHRVFKHRKSKHKKFCRESSPTTTLKTKSKAKPDT